MKEKLHLLSRHVSETAGSLLVNKIGAEKHNKSVSEWMKQMLHVHAVSIVQCCWAEYFGLETCQHVSAKINLYHFLNIRRCCLQLILRTMKVGDLVHCPPKQDWSFSCTDVLCSCCMADTAISWTHCMAQKPPVPTHQRINIWAQHVSTVTRNLWLSSWCNSVVWQP